MFYISFPLTLLLPFGILLLICDISSATSSNSSAAAASTPNLSAASVRAVPSNASRAHYYIYEKPEPTPTHIEWYTSTSAAPSGGAGWSASSSVDYGWTTISPTNAGWPSSTTTDYGGWATATPTPSGWSPAPPPPPPPSNGWTSPTPAPPPPNNGWAAPTPAPPPPPPPTSGWSAPPPPSNPGWPAPTPPPNNGWGAPPAPTPAPSGWAPSPPPPPSTSVGGWSPPTPGWAAPGGCSTLDCVYLENYIISNILNSSSYHKELRPPPYDTPTKVSVDVFIKNILSIDDSTKMWKAQLTLRQQWNDPRLSYSTQGCSSYKYFTLTNTDSIWTPDLFFPLEEEATYHNVPQRNILVWIAPNGDVTYSTRITLTMNCRGRKTQNELICPLIIGSYAYSSDKMTLQWLTPDPVQIDLDRIDLPNYTVGKVATSGNGDPSAYLGQFPGVVAKFTFVKKQNQCRFG